MLELPSNPDAQFAENDVKWQASGLQCYSSLCATFPHFVGEDAEGRAKVQSVRMGEVAGPYWQDGWGESFTLEIRLGTLLFVCMRSVAVQHVT